VNCLLKPGFILSNRKGIVWVFYHLSLKMLEANYCPNLLACSILNAS
jgi:hypothetical protein